MSVETAYHAVTLATTAALCGGLGFIFGYGWGFETGQAEPELTLGELPTLLESEVLAA